MSKLQHRGHVGVAGAGGKRIFLPIYEAETGFRIDVEIVEEEEGMEVLRRKLFSSTAVPPENQILLCGGPPYKPLRSTLPRSILVPVVAAAPAAQADGTTSQPRAETPTTTAGKTNRVYLFDWRTLAPERSVPSASPGGGALGSSTLVPGKGSGTPAGSTSTAAVSAAAQEAAVQEAVEAAEFVGPLEVELPPEAGPVLSLPSAQGSGLLKTIANCGRYSLSALNRGEAYLEASSRRLQGGEDCVERMGIQIDALEAAVSNSLDHGEPLQRSYSALKEKLEEQALRHGGMLETFERDLTALGSIPLHPSLASNPESDAVAGGGSTGSSREERSPSFSGRTDVGWEVSVSSPGFGGGDGGQESLSRQGKRDGLGQQQQRKQQAVRRVTLLDCVPVELEHKLLESCRTSQRRFGQEGKVVAQKHATINRGIEKQRADPVSGDEQVKGLLERARELCGDQERLTAELRKNYSESFQLASKENWTDDQEKQDAIRRMTELMATQENIVPAMRENDLQVRATVVEIARAKATLSFTMRRRLREVSKLQTDIGKIQKHQELVRMAWGQKEEQFEHLGKVARMPAAYGAFLREVARRKRYHENMEAKVEEFCSSMTALRATEILARENFRQTHLGNLPPVFVEMAPGLRSIPPVFTPPQVTPLQPGELPEVDPSDVTEMDKAQSAEKSTVMASAATQAPVAIAAATQTEEEPPRHSGGTGESCANVGLNIEDKGDDDVQEQTAPAEEEEPGQETIAEADREKGTAHDQEKEKASASALLKEENVRLAAEVAEARARLEELKQEAQARVEAAAEAAAASSGKRAEAFTNTAASPERPPGGAEEATSPAKDVAATGTGVRYVAETMVKASPTTRETVSEAEGEDVVTGMRGRERSAHKGKSAGADGGEGRGRSVSDVVAGAGWDSAKPAPEKRGLSRAATQKQLVAYRTGLSMLVKLCNQLTAASSVTAGFGRGGVSRADSETNLVASSVPRRAPEGTLSGATPVESRSGDPSVEPSSSMVTGEPGPGTVPSAGAANVATIAEPTGSPVAFEDSRQVATVACADDANVATVAEPTGSPVAFEDSRPVATVAGADDATGAVKGGAEGRDAATSSANRIPEATELEEPPREVAGAVAVAAGVETPGVEASLKAVTTEGGLASAAGGGGAGTAGAEGEGEKNPAAPASQGEAASVATQKPSPAGTSSGAGTAGVERDAGVGSDTGPKQIVAERSASKGVDKIKRVAEHVAAHIRRSHSRIEELHAFEAMASVPRISMCSFNVQDIALFLPTMVGLPKGSGGTVFLAFHVNCPNRYLSEESSNTARQNLGSSPTFILGRIIMIEQHVATEEPNPYNVASNTVYYVLTAENLC